MKKPSKRVAKRKATSKKVVKRRTTAKTKPRRKTSSAKKGLSGIVAKPKYRKGEFVYSHLNPGEKRQICEVKPSKQRSSQHKYRLTLSNAQGMPKKSSWITEAGLSKRKIR